MPLTAGTPSAQEEVCVSRGRSRKKVPASKKERVFDNRKRGDSLRRRIGTITAEKEASSAASGKEDRRVDSLEKKLGPRKHQGSYAQHWWLVKGKLLSKGEERGIAAEEVQLKKIHCFGIRGPERNEIFLRREGTSMGMEHPPLVSEGKKESPIGGGRGYQNS